MEFTLTRPCPKCPFRTDVRPFLMRERAEEISEMLVERQGVFPCHNTVDYSIEEESRSCIDGTQHCAGAMIIMEKIERPNQLMRIAERCNLYDRTKLDMEAPVFDTFEEFIEAQEL